MSPPYVISIDFKAHLKDVKDATLENLVLDVVDRLEIPVHIHAQINDTLSHAWFGLRIPKGRAYRAADAAAAALDSKAK
jgi:hypothetical protein